MFSGLKFIPREQVEKEHDESDDESEKRSKKSGKNKQKDRRKKKSKRYSSSDEDLEKIKKGSKKKKKWYASDEDLSSESESESEYEKKKHRSKKGKKDKGRDTFSSEDEDKVRSKKNKGKNQDIENKHKDDGSLIRKEMGLDWMLRPKDVKENILENQIDEASIEEVKKVNPRELNPYFKDSGSGYPEEESSGGSKLISSTIIGDGGASWRLKALKRAKEQAARENRKLDEVVEERWGSVSELAVSVATNRSANTRAHLHAIHNRRKDFNTSSDTGDSVRHKMKVPKVQDSLAWGKRDRKVFDEDSRLVSSAISGINKFNNDGNFMSQFMQPKNDESNSISDKKMESDLTTVKDVSIGKVQLSSNQVAAKVMQLRMKGKHEEAEKLLKEAENLKVEEGVNNESTRTRYDGNTSRIIMHDKSIQDRKREEDGDLNLARRITGNHKYSVTKQADDEYDYDDGPRKKSRKKGDIDNRKPNKTVNFGNNMMRQHEKCQFCFENPTRPKHLVISIANFAYLSLPQWEPVVPGHCCILTMQHESATRSLDDNVWNEIRNFKKCLMMMFGKQEKDVVFIETVMGISQQRHHCLVECIPLPREIAKQAPVYFKKAIDEAEDEWSQHNAKKLIDTSEKGLRGSIPKNFPYFYVEFGLDKGYVHVIDDEKGFKGSFGLNVVRGMLRLSAEDMNRRRKHESVDKQKEAVVNFARDWEPFDWTKQLDS